VAANADLFRSLRERVMGQRGVIMLIGAQDTGKTTLAKLLTRDALGRGNTVAFVDADVGGSTVGPLACAGLKFIKSAVALESLGAADEIRFVGSTSPQGVVLQHVVAAAALVEIARNQADVVILDTTSVVAGVVGQTLKYHLMELCAPALVIALQRGGELEPIIGMLRRFLSARVAVTTPASDLPVPSPLDRSNARREALAAEFGGDVQRWKVQSTVFAPTLPEGFDHAKLHGMLVGIQDGTGRCLGLGALEEVDGALYVATAHGEQMQGLRLGSIRIDLDTYETQPVRLRQLIFGV
jgi:polynucleotide 5'-kinase involved in rRNA processing